LKTKLRKLLPTVWKSLTDVPGWPDAPVSLRLRRSLPFVLPLLATGLLLTWYFGYALPRRRELHATHAPLLQLEREVASLHQAFSEQQVAEIAVREADLVRILPADAKAVREILRTIEQEAQRLGWEVAFSAPTVSDNGGRKEQGVGEVPVRLRLKPAAANVEPFATLLNVMDQLSAQTRRIGLMRLAISADEGRWQTVEVGLRFTVPLSHAQAAQ
jgi:hypothetical protein